MFHLPAKIKNENECESKIDYVGFTGLIAITRKLLAVLQYLNGVVSFFLSF